MCFWIVIDLRVFGKKKEKQSEERIEALNWDIGFGIEQEERDRDRRHPMRLMLL